MSPRINRCLALGSVSALALALFASPQAGYAKRDASPPAGQAAKIKTGKATFDAVGCSGCHGYGGQGGIGPSTGPRISDLPAEALIAIIRRPPSPMPYFSAKVLPDAKVEEIAAYLNALPKPRDAATIPLLAHATEFKK